METKYTLDGKNVTIFLRGGWSFSGKVEYISDTQIILDEGDEDSDFISIYREEIVAARVHSDEKIKPIPVPKLYQSQSNLPREVDLEEVYSGEDINHYGSLIPEDMLEGDEDPYSVDLSMSGIDFGQEINKKEPKRKKRGAQ